MMRDVNAKSPATSSASGNSLSTLSILKYNY